jgi:predicted ester cyclase
VSEDIRITVRRIWEELIPRCDEAALREVIHSDGVDHDGPVDRPGGPEQVAATGRWLNEVFADLRFEVHQVLADGDTAAVHCTTRGRQVGNFMGLPPTGREVAVPAVHIVRFDDGKVIEHWYVRDDLTMLRQLGMAPTPARTE